MYIKPIKNNRKQWDESQYSEVYGMYQAFLALEQAGTKYQKAATVREIAEMLNRSKGSIEALCMNISAIHKDLLNMPYVSGYKPLSNYSHKLAAFVCKVNSVDYEK